MSPRAAQIEHRALPAIAVAVLVSLHQHRLLTARQVHALHTPHTSLRWTQRILAELHTRGLAERADGPRGVGLWFLSAHGADTIAAAGTLDEGRRRLTTAAQAAGPLRAHTLAVNDSGIAFVRAARQRPGDDCAALSWRHEIAHPYTAGRGRHGTHLLIADALLSYLQAGSEQSLILHQRFIELDRGTIAPEQLAVKLARYGQLRDYTPKPASGEAPEGPLWRAYYRVFPTILVVLADQSPEAARRRIARVIALAGSDPRRERHTAVPVSFVTLSDLTSKGPFSPVFICAEAPATYRDWLGDTHQHQVKGEHDVSR